MEPDSEFDSSFTGDSQQTGESSLDEQKDETPGRSAKQVSPGKRGHILKKVTELDEIKQEEADLDDSSVKMEPDSEFDSSFTGDSQQTGESSLDEQKDDSVSDDPLTALAPAAFDHSKEYKKTEPTDSEQPAKDTWYTVGFVKGSSFDVNNYFLLEGDIADLTINNLPDLSHYPKMNLEPGTTYKFRVVAINSVGRGEWSEVSAFRTGLPGFPGAPSAIKIEKSADGAHLSWEPASTNQGKILEYSVFLAVRGKDKTNPPGQFAFERVYCGPNNMCVVNFTSLAAAHLDTSTKAAIIFRIAAKNDKGYGLATQVRWLQDLQATNKPTKRVPDGVHQVKKIKYEEDM